MIRAGVAIDDWKRPVFEQHLKANDFTFDEVPSGHEGVTMLRVACPRDRVEELKQVVAIASGLVAALRDMPGKAN